MSEAFPEAVTICDSFKFPGRGQQNTPVADARGIVGIILHLPGRATADFRKQAASVMVRYLGGDLCLVDEVAAICLAQEQLPENHPARLFGQTVESEAMRRKREENEIAGLQVPDRVWHLYRRPRPHAG